MSSALSRSTKADPGTRCTWHGGCQLARIIGGDDDDEHGPDWCEANCA